MRVHVYIHRNICPRACFLRLGLSALQNIEYELQNALSQNHEIKFSFRDFKSAFYIFLFCNADYSLLIVPRTKFTFMFINRSIFACIYVYTCLYKYENEYM